MKVSVYGHTHYSWVTAAKLAEKGNDVTLCLRGRESGAGYDAGRERLLPELIQAQQDAGRLHIDKACGELDSDVHFLADDYTEESLQKLLVQIVSGKQKEIIVLVMMPLPVGTLQRLQTYWDKKFLAEKKPGKLYLAALPLFIREGTALADFERPQLFLLGSEEKPVIDCVQELMRAFMRQATEVMVVPVATAELIKFSIISMLATRVSFMNEMAALAEKVGVDIELVRQGMAADPRVGGAYLEAGCGFGGPSFSGELLSLAKTIKEELDTSGLIDAVLSINESQKEILFRKIWRFYRGDLKGKVISVWGCAFKPGTSSINNSVVHPLLQALWAQGCQTRVYDPQALPALARVYPDQPLLILSDSSAEAAEGSDGIALVTAWDEFWNPDFDAVAASMNNVVMFDGRNIYEPEQMEAHGFHYFGIGRGGNV